VQRGQAVAFGAIERGVVKQNEGSRVGAGTGVRKSSGRLQLRTDVRTDPLVAAVSSTSTSTSTSKFDSEELAAAR
jgi:hypothetical protein